MRVLLSDGSGLTSRQVAGRAKALGHTVGVLASDPLALTRWTNAVQGWHKVPPFGIDPVRWLDVAVRIAVAGRYDVLLPTQEQVTVLSWAQGTDCWDSSVATAVPPFRSLQRVQDKISSARTLAALGLPRPGFAVLHSEASAEGRASFPAFVKPPIGTASFGVRRVNDRYQLSAALESGGLREALHSGAGVLVEEAIDGPLAMVQAVFDRGRMVAFHANRRVAEGSGGGASHKESIDLPDVRTDLTRLGNHLDWHGGLSADVILSPARGPQIIDINPRLVEPGNAMRSGVDLVATLLEVAIGGNPATGPSGTSGVRTHQLLLAILGAAQQDGSRRAVWWTTLEAMLHRGLYRGSSEELTPLTGDYRAVVPLAAALTLTSLLPRLGKGLASSSTGTYAVSAQGWEQLVGTFSNRP